MPVFGLAAAAGPLPTTQKATTAAARDREPGGEADQPGPVPGMGWFVTCPDPQDNKFGPWQTDPSAPAPAG